MSAPYREVASRLKKLLATGRVIEGSLCRADRGDAVRYQLSDSRRTVLPCRDCAGSTRDVTKSGLLMTPAARRSRDVGVICNLCGSL